MSGIAGLVDPSLDREQGKVLLTAMIESIRHRGPDHSVQWIDLPVLLGHNRLSAIDLSAAAGQPMAEPKGWRCRRRPAQCAGLLP